MIAFILSSMLSLAVVVCFRLADIGRPVLMVPIEAARDFAERIIMTPFRQVYATTRTQLHRFSLVAVQLIRGLKPEYRDSYQTHGLSLST